MTIDASALEQLTKDQLVDFGRRMGVNVPVRYPKADMIAMLLDANEPVEAGDDDHLGFPGQPGHPSE